MFVSVGPWIPTSIACAAVLFFKFSSGEENWLKFKQRLAGRAWRTTELQTPWPFRIYSAAPNIGDLPSLRSLLPGCGIELRARLPPTVLLIRCGQQLSVEATIEYRFPCSAIISGQVFIDGGTHFGPQVECGRASRRPAEQARQVASRGPTGLIGLTAVGPLRLRWPSREAFTR